jgi:crossover junction endodeoxyribonuclease RusA
VTSSIPKRAADRAPVDRRAARAATPAAGAGQPDPPVVPTSGGSGPTSSSQSRERAPTRMPSPDTGAERLSSQRNAPVRGRPTQAPAGASLLAHGSPPAGPRTFTLALPPGLALLSLNDRGHWAARYRRSEALKKAAWALALSQRVPRLERVSVTVEYQPRDLRRRDGDNIAASAKALIDGLRAAGVLPEDDSRHVTEVTCRIGSLYPKGRLVLTLTEVPAATDGAA